MKNWKSFSKVPSNSEICDVAASRDLSADVLFVILLKVDPNSIFRCILVSKDWLQVIARSDFRRSYLEKWRNDFPVAGFMHEYGRFKLVATNKMGSRINKSKMWNHWRLVNRSRSGDGLLLFFNPETDVFLLKLVTGGVILTLPPPPILPSESPELSRRNTAILSSYDKDGSFEVVSLEVKTSLEYSKRDATLNFRVFSSSTLTWKLMSQFTHHSGFDLLPDPPGLGSIQQGILYWRVQMPYGVENCRVLVYNTKTKRIRLRSEPKTRLELPQYHYDVSSQGCLQCAVMGLENVIGSENEIGIWSFSDDGWSCLYNLGRSRLLFLSFVPGRSDSIFVAENQDEGALRGSSSMVIHTYHLDTLKMERFEGKASFKDLAYGRLVPYTVPDLGVWPSFPSHAKRNKLITSLKRLCN